MVDRSYLEGKASPPGQVRLYVDQQLVPVAIDVAGTVEAVVERLATQVRHTPAIALGAAVLIGLAISSLGRRSV